MIVYEFKVKGKEAQYRAIGKLSLSEMVKT